MNETPIYDAAKTAVREYKDADLGQPTLEQWATMAVDVQPERDAALARARAERNVDLLLRGCWEMREKLNAARVAPEYRQAVYKERLGVSRGRDAYLLMETKPEAH